MASLQAQHFFGSMSPSEQARIRASWGGADLMDSWYQNAVNAGAVPGAAVGSAPAGGGVDPHADPYASNPAVQAGRKINSDIPDAQWAAWEKHFDPSCPPESPFRMTKEGAGGGCGESPDNCPPGTHQQGSKCASDGPEPGAPAAAQAGGPTAGAAGGPGAAAAAHAAAPAPPPKPKSLQDLLLEMFQNRQGVFGAEPGQEKSPYVDANQGGTPGAASLSSGNPAGFVYGSEGAANPFAATGAAVGSSPLSQALVGAQGVGGGGLGQGLIWYDPNYQKPQQAAAPAPEANANQYGTQGTSTSGGSSAAPQPSPAPWVPGQDTTRQPQYGGTDPIRQAPDGSNEFGYDPFSQNPLSAQLTKQKRQPRQPFAFGQNGVPSWDQAMSGRY